MIVEILKNHIKYYKIKIFKKKTRFVFSQKTVFYENRKIIFFSSLFAVLLWYSHATLTRENMVNYTRTLITKIRLHFSAFYFTLQNENYNCTKLWSARQIARSNLQNAISLTKIIYTRKLYIYENCIAYLQLIVIVTIVRNDYDRILMDNTIHGSSLFALLKE